MNLKWPSIFKRERVEDVKQTDNVVVIIGPTGVGKSSFINIAADQKLKVDNSKPCTTELALVRCTFEDKREVVFVDTPPFPDPNGNAAEKEVGNSINEWVKKSLGEGIKVTRILYLHDISRNRYTELFPHYEIFRKLCGNQYSASVALVLTMCENVVDPKICKERTDFLTGRWKSLMGKKAVVYSHYGTKESAWVVVGGLGVI